MTLRIFLLLQLIFFSNTIIAKNISIAIDQDYPPYMYKTATGNVDGLYVRHHQAIFSRLGENVNIQAYPWKRTLSISASGEAAIGGLLKTPEREKIYDYSTPIHDEKLFVYVKSGKEFIFNTLEDLRTKKVGILLGWSYGKEIDKAIKNKLFKTDIAPGNINNIEKLLRDRVDCIILDELQASLIIAKENLQGKIQKLEKPIASNSVYIAFSKKTKQKDLLEKLNTTVKKMNEEGVFEKIFKEFVDQSK